MIAYYTDKALRFWNAGLICVLVGNALSNLWWLHLALGLLFAYTAMALIVNCWMKVEQHRRAQ